nr:PREDICTED: uncharacterized protein LOC106701408 [Bos mutus]
MVKTLTWRGQRLESKSKEKVELRGYRISVRAPSKPEGACAERRALSRAAVWPAVSGEWPEWSGQRRVRWLGDSGASWTESQRAREFRPSGQGAKASCAVQGELNCCNSMSALEMHQRLEQLKRRIHRVHLYSQDAKRRRRKRKPKKPERVLSQDRSTSPCLLPALLPPGPPLLPTASTAAPPPAVYTMPRVFGPFPPLPSTSLEEVEVSRSEVKLNWTGLSSNPKSHMVDLTPLVLNPGGFHFSYLTRNNAHKLHFPWTSVCNSPAAPEEMPSSSVRASIFTPPVLLKFQPVPRPTGDSENDPGNAESVPHQREQSPLLYRPRPEDE